MVHLFGLFRSVLLKISELAEKSRQTENIRRIIEISSRIGNSEPDRQQNWFLRDQLELLEQISKEEMGEIKNENLASAGRNILERTEEPRLISKAGRGLKPYEQTRVIGRGGEKKGEERYEISYSGNSGEIGGHDGDMVRSKRSDKGLGSRGSRSPDRTRKAGGKGRVSSPRRQSPRSSNRRIGSPNRKKSPTHSKNRTQVGSPGRKRHKTDGGSHPNSHPRDFQQGYPVSQSQMVYADYKVPQGYFNNTGSQYGAPIYPPPPYQPVHPGYAIGYHHGMAPPGYHDRQHGARSEISDNQGSMQRQHYVYPSMIGVPGHFAQPYPGYPVGHVGNMKTEGEHSNHLQGRVEQSKMSPRRQSRASPNRINSPRRSPGRQRSPGKQRSPNKQRSPGKQRSPRASPGRQRSPRGSNRDILKNRESGKKEKYFIDAKEIRLSGSGHAEYLQKNVGQTENNKGVIDSIDQIPDFSKRNIKFFNEVKNIFSNVALKIFILFI